MLSSNFRLLVATLPHRNVYRDSLEIMALVHQCGRMAAQATSAQRRQAGVKQAATGECREWNQRSHGASAALAS